MRVSTNLVSSQSNNSEAKNSMEIAVWGPVIAKERRELEEMGEDPKEQLDEIHDQQRETNLLVRVEEMGSSKHGRGFMSHCPPYEYNWGGDKELNDPVPPKPP